MLCFLPPLPAAPRPRQPSAPPTQRATEVVLLIVIVMNCFFVLAALIQPLLGPGFARPAHAAPAAPTSCEADAKPAPMNARSGATTSLSCRPA